MYLSKEYAKPYTKLIIVMIILKVLGTAAELIIPMGFVYMMDNIVPLNSPQKLIEFGAVMIGIAFFAMVVSLIVSHQSVKFGVDVCSKIRLDLFDKTCKLDCEQVDFFGISSLTSRLTTDIALFQTFITKMFTKGIRMLILFIGSLTSISIIDNKLAFIMLCTVPLIAITVYFTSTLSFKRFKETKKSNDDLVKLIRDNVMGIRVVKALSKFEFEKDRFEICNDNLKAKSIKASSVNVVGSPIMRLIVNLGMVTTLILGAYWVSEGKSNPASIIAFMSYSTMLLTSLVNIGQMFTSFSRAAAAGSRIEEVLKTKSREYNGYNVDSNENTDNDNFIEFKNVSFSYNESENIILNEINFTLKEGETLGIIGITGAGKSTILSLLLRLYEPTKGEILIKNKPINSYTKEELYKIFGMVFQADVVFSESVTDNIAFGRDIAQSEIEFASKSAQAEMFINRLTDKYNQLVNIRGQNISGGEKQRLLISRALAGAPQILILDDSTSALDYKTDALLRKSLAENFATTTKILVSQRVSSIMNANIIIVIDKGEIIAKGKHDEVMKSCDLYKKIATLQSQNSNIIEEEV